MLNLNDLRIFVGAVECGGFTAAGRRLGLPKSTVSKRVAELEAALQARLIHRTSRSFALTDIGRDFYEHARAAVIEAEDAEAIVRRRQAEPSGVVKITASVPTAQLHLASRIPLLARTYPKLEIQLDVTDRFVDLVQEGFDIAVRSHFAPLPDSDLMQKRMRCDPIVLLASPDYLERRGTPESPQALAAHDGLLSGPSAKVWRLIYESGPTIEVAPIPRLIADESSLLLGAAVAGLGVTCLPSMMCSAALADASLARVLPDWTAGSVTTTILTPHRRGQLPSVRAVIDFLSEPSPPRT